MAGDSPVWRFEVERIDTSNSSNTGFKPLRYVYMADPGSDITYSDGDEDQEAGDIEVFFGDSRGATVAPGTQALVGTEGFRRGDISQVFMGRRTDADETCLLYTSPSPRDQRGSRMPSSA